MINKLNNNSLFEEIYCAVLTLIGIICYCYAPMVGMILIISIAALTLIIFNDFKYFIPCLLTFIFSNRNTLTTNQFPISFLISSLVLVAVLIFFMIKNKPDFKKLKSGKGIFLLGIVSILPIFWHNIVPKGSELLYFLYFTYLAFFIVYVMFSSSLKKDSFRMLIKAIGYMAVLIALECNHHIAHRYYENPDVNIFKHAFDAGWGICNEAGIMLCFAIPFMCISLVSKKNVGKIFIEIFKLSIVVAGMVLTNSRGTYIFGGIELVLLFIWVIIRAPKRWFILLGTIIAIVSTLGIVELILGVDYLVDSIQNVVFVNQLSDNGRYSLWIKAYNLWNTDFVKMTFGSGMVAEFYPDGSRYIVYHSTFFQILATTGSLGIAFLVIHFIDKYKLIKKFDLTSKIILIIGFIAIDIYGMVDNTYGMYYFMIPLMIVMGTMDNVEEYKVDSQY